MTYSNIFRESGTRIVIPSMSGVLGKKGRSVQGLTGTLQLTAPASYYVLPDNARRVCLFIFNEGPGNLVVSIGTPADMTDVCRLPASSSFQFDKDFPWSGAVCMRCDSLGVDAPVMITEISVEE